MIRCPASIKATDRSNNYRKNKKKHQTFWSITRRLKPISTNLGFPQIPTQHEKAEHKGDGCEQPRTAECPESEGLSHGGQATRLLFLLLRVDAQTPRAPAKCRVAESARNPQLQEPKMTTPDEGLLTFAVQTCVMPGPTKGNNRKPTILWGEGSNLQKRHAYLTGVIGSPVHAHLSCRSLDFLVSGPSDQWGS